MARVNVRAKGRAVNSVFLVQLRKMLAADFRGSARIKGLVRDVSLSRIGGVDSVCGTARGGKIIQAGEVDCAQELHRKCR
ncbi:MAG: hypothetical protein WBP98_12475, partial [Candidatus Sulfotelmatobacter sp.]